MPRIAEHPNWPSVTEILEAFGYYAVYRDSAAVRDHKAKLHDKYHSNCVLCRGSWIDLACRMYAEGNILDEASIAGATRLGWVGYLNSFINAWQLHRCELVDAQMEVVNELHRYVGHYDLMTKTGLWELKAGALIDKAVALQTGAYALDADVSRFGVALQHDGSPAIVRPYTDPDDITRFRIYARAWHQMREDGVL